jgi:hypothetical protein
MPDMTKHPLIIKQTQNWLSNVVIAHSICPFAKREFDRGSIHYEVIETNEIEQQLEQLILNYEQLDKDFEIETTLLIFPNSFTDFYDYLDFVELANQLMHKQGYEGVYQVATFHPDYRFADSDESDASNYTNRSPYPMLHILREASVEKVLANYPDPEGIPERNIGLTRELGLTAMQKLLADSY